MRKVLLIILPLLFLAILATSCDPTVKLAKSNNIADKDTAAMRFVRDGKCEQANYLLQELLSVYRMQSRAEEIYYYYAYCKYNMGSYLEAAYYFDDFVRQYPRSEHVEEFRYLNAYCYYLLSPPWYLDQTYTYKAIEKMQLFSSQNPYSQKVGDAQTSIKELQEKLARKSFEQANLYLKIGYYKSAVQGFQITLQEHGSSSFAEESQFRLFESAKLLADASIDTKKEERYEEALELKQKFDAKFPNSKFASSAENLEKDAQKQLDKLKADSFGS